MKLYTKQNIDEILDNKIKSYKNMVKNKSFDAIQGNAIINALELIKLEIEQ